MSKIIFITGATSGIGKAAARKFAASGYDLIITGRRKERLEELQKEITSHYNTAVICLCYDIRNHQAGIDAINSLPDEWKNIHILLNNAGLAAGRDYFDEASFEDWETMIDTNIKGLLYTTRAIIPFMIKEGKGHIINIGSTAGKEAYEKGNVYCATKFAVNALSQSMRIDLLKHGIKSTVINPGAVLTEFSMVRLKGNQELADKVYEGYQPLSPEDVAETIYFVASQPPHVCLNEIVMTSTAQANSFYLHKKA